MNQKNEQLKSEKEEVANFTKEVFDVAGGKIAQDIKGLVPILGSLFMGDEETGEGVETFLYIVFEDGTIIEESSQIAQVLRNDKVICVKNHKKIHDESLKYEFYCISIDYYLELFDNNNNAVIVKETTLYSEYLIPDNIDRIVFPHDLVVKNANFRFTPQKLVFVRWEKFFIEYADPISGISIFDNRKNRISSLLNYIEGIATDNPALATQNILKLFLRYFAYGYLSCNGGIYGDIGGAESLFGQTIASLTGDCFISFDAIFNGRFILKRRIKFTSGNFDVSYTRNISRPEYVVMRDPINIQMA